MEMSEISCNGSMAGIPIISSSILFIMFQEKVMQKALTPQRQSENDFIADDAVEEAEETDMPRSSVSIAGQPLCNLRFACHTESIKQTNKYDNRS